MGETHRDPDRMTTASETRERLLDAAEELFADRGFGPTSVRQITQRAGANVAAVHYHYGGKEPLLRAVLDRRMRPVNLERIRRLERLSAGDRWPGVEAILTAYLEPMLRLDAERESAAGRISRLLTRLLAESPDGLDEYVRAPFEDTVRRFLDALARAVPEVPRAELYLRLRLAIGVMIHIGTGLVEARILREYSDGAAAPGRTPLGPVVAFLAAGFRSPALLQVASEALELGEAAR